MTSADWHEYYEAARKKPLHPLFARLEPELREGGHALELGCGVGHGVRFLLAHGLTVHAVDVNPEPIASLDRADGLTTEVSPFESLALAVNQYDLVVAGFSLFFLPPTEFERFWPRVTDCLRDGGVFMGQFLGPNDEWRDRGYTLHTGADLESVFRGFSILHHEEVERDGETAQGTPKRWHVHHVIARKL